MGWGDLRTGLPAIAKAFPVAGKNNDKMIK
jgi:hypothetical protein